MQLQCSYSLQLWSTAAIEHAAAEHCSRQPAAAPPASGSPGRPVARASARWPTPHRRCLGTRAPRNARGALGQGTAHPKTPGKLERRFQQRHATLSLGNFRKHSEQDFCLSTEPSFRLPNTAVPGPAPRRFCCTRCVQVLLPTERSPYAIENSCPRN